MGAGLAALLALTSSGQAQELPAVSTAPDSVVPPPTAPAPRPRPLGGHAALSNAIELQRRGEFEQAAVQLDMAQAQKDMLTPTEQEELARLLQANRNSLAARRQAHRLLDQAEQALRERQIPRGRELVRRLTALEPALTAPDRQRLDTVRRGLGVVLRGPSALGEGSPLQLAHTKVQQARALLSQGNFDAAERVARDAAALNAEFGPKEDRPEKVLEDVAKARRDPRALLSASRGALQAGELDRAEELAAAADRASGTFTFPLWSDTPAKVRRDIQTARTRKEGPPIGQGQPAPERKRSGSMVESMKNFFGGKGKEKTDDNAATETMSAAQTPASKPVAQETYGAQGYAVTGNLTAQRNERPAPNAAQTPNKAPAAQTPVETPESPRSATIVANTEAARRLLEQGRRALHDGNLERATRCAEAAQARKPDLAFWEDNPERLKHDIQRVAAARNAGSDNSGEVALVSRKTPAAAPPDGVPAAEGSQRKTPESQQEADAMLKEGRKLLAAGKLDEAASLAAAIQAFQGRYGLFDDTPEKLATDVKKTRTERDRTESAKALKEGRRAFEKGNLDRATTLAYRAQQLHGPYYIWELGDRPNKLLADIQAERNRRPAGQSSAVAKRPDDRGTAAADRQPVEGNTDIRLVGQQSSPAKERAQQLVAEAQGLQRQSRLLEARQKALQAQAQRVPFGVEEMSPERLLLQLASQARQQTDRMVQQAMDVAQYGQGEPRTNYQWAEQQLQAAHRLAEGFGFEVRTIADKLNWVTQMRSRLPGGPQGAAQQPTAAPGVARVADNGIPPGATPRGLELLELSRLELRKGQTVTARKLAEEAYTGEYGVKDLAMRRLREIDIEENNQRKLEACRAFDAGVAAFNRRNLFQAKAILSAVSVRLLDPVRQARMREVMLTPEMGSTTLDPNVQLAGRKQPAPGAPGTAPTLSPPGDGGPAVTPAPGVARSTDRPESSLEEITLALQNVQFQELREKQLQAMREASDLASQKDFAGAMEVLSGFLLHLPESQLDAGKLALLRRPVESRLANYGPLRAQAEIDKQTGDASQKAKSNVTQAVLQEANKQKRVTELLASFNKSYRDAKYRDAYQFASLAHEMDPDNAVATTAMLTAKTMIRKDIHATNKDEREKMNFYGWEDAEKEGPFVNVENPVAFDKNRYEIAKKRKAYGMISLDPKKKAAEREIESKLDLPVTLNWSNAPLRQVIADIRATHGINIVPDTIALQQENVSLERPVTIQLENVSLKSALNLLLRQLELTWVIRDEVLQITTKMHAKGDLVQRTYLVADLVTPIENYSAPASTNFVDQLERNQQRGVQAGPGGAMQGGPGLPGGQPANTSGGSMGSPGGTNSEFGASNSNSNNGQWSVNRRNNSMQEQLIKLITSAIAYDSWQTNGSGGPGSIDYFPLAATLVINQTLDIQEQIADLLAALRRLQDQEVTIEVRLITIADAFFERLGLDLNINIKTDRDTRRFEPMLTTGQFKPVPFINDFSPSRFIAGLTPAGTFTSDLDIPINPTSFAMTVPPFGAFPNNPGNNGGLTLGLAFLSDIQVFFFMEAAQGDQRTNVMQAPRLTMFNGQSASLSVQNQQFFVTQVQAIQNGGELFFLPTNQNFATGVQISLQPVITGDRRFVRINFNLSLTNLASAIVPLFPITTTIQPFFEGIGNVGNPTLFTQYIQQPVFSSVLVNTTVVVPDGGTVLLGGLKRLSEGRNEFGPPILGKIPYLDRLFRNVGYGRETESILMMVTPRIIINEEEEIQQTGVISAPTLVQ